MEYKQSTLAVNGSYNFPCPSSMTWGKQDISDSDSGRAQYTGLMYKNKIAEKIKLELSWKALNQEDTHNVLVAFKDEYFDVTYYDPLEGRNTTKTFYCGDMSAPVYSWYQGGKIYNEVSFNIIER